MNLQEFLLFFREHSGRYDLVGDDGEDQGALVFIQAGQQFLDRQGVVPQETATTLRLLQGNQKAVVYQNARHVAEVILVGAGWKKRLTRMTYDEIRDVQGGTGTPSSYAIVPPRMIQQGEAPPVTEGLLGQVDLLALGEDSYSVILLNCSADQTFGLEIRGAFYQRKLINPDDSNFWTVNYPNLLLAASMRQLEMIYRNSEGIRDWENAMALDLRTLELDRVAEESQDVIQMRG